MRDVLALSLVLVAGLATSALGDGTPAKADTQGEAAGVSGGTQRKSMLSRRPAPKQDDKHDNKHDDKPSAQHDAKASTPTHADAAVAAPHADEHTDPKSAAPAKVAAAHATATATEHASEPPTAAQALAWLQEGNARWVKGEAQNPSSDAAQRELAAGGQHPFVSVLSCADSRVPLERLFDRGVGEIFAVRVAGNVAGESEVGTLEYGTQHLHTPLLVVMGHTKCGAVAAAASGAQVHGKVASLLAHVAPAVDRAKALHPQASGDELVALSVQENVWQTISTLLRESSGVRELVESGKLTIVGAVYDIASGEVRFIGSHPWQRELLAASNAMHTQQVAAAGAAHDSVPAGKTAAHVAAPVASADVDTHADDDAHADAHASHDEKKDDH
jgi:carbonic anhydrase